MKNGARHSTNNRSNQLNPNNGAYWSSRGLSGVPSEEGNAAPAQPTNAPEPNGPKESGK